jgi:hypothetical protein
MTTEKGVNRGAWEKNGNRKNPENRITDDFRLRHGHRNGEKKEKSNDLLIHRLHRFHVSAATYKYFVELLDQI